jgi:hypothetical protein
MDIFFINMRIPFKQLLGQLSCLPCLFFFLVCFLVLGSCGTGREDNPVIPPITSPLTSDFIGFGVINDSFTHVLKDPLENSDSLGYLRRGSLVRVLRRQLIRTQTGFVSWVFINGEQQGWLKEEVMSIYNNERQARTASDVILK